jgi:hypothetical protein
MNVWDAISLAQKVKEEKDRFEPFLLLSGCCDVAFNVREAPILRVWEVCGSVSFKQPAQKSSSFGISSSSSSSQPALSLSKLEPMSSSLDGPASTSLASLSEKISPLHPPALPLPSFSDTYQLVCIGIQFIGQQAMSAKPFR